MDMIASMKRWNKQIFDITAQDRGLKKFTLKLIEEVLGKNHHHKGLEQNCSSLFIVYDLTVGETLIHL